MTPYDVSTTSDPFGSVPPNFRKGAKPTWHQRRRHRTVLSLLRGLSGRVLDYGCGYGDLTHAISRTHAVVGCDVDPQRVAFARREYAPLEFVECPPDGAPYEDASFDVVVSSVVIPFVPDPAEYLGRIHRLLRDRGHLILVTANEPVVQNAFRRVLGRSKAVARLWIPPLAEVRSLVTNCGFDVIDSTFFYDPPGDGWKNGSDYVIGGIEQVLSVVGVGRTAHYHAYLAVKR